MTDAARKSTSWLSTGSTHGLDALDREVVLGVLKPLVHVHTGERLLRRCDEVLVVLAIKNLECEKGIGSKGIL